MKLNPRLAVLIVIAELVALASAQCPPPSAPAASNHYFFYQLVLLNRPANAPQLDEDAAQKLQDSHMANIRRLAKEGKLLVAGPFLDDTPLRGFFVLKTESLKEAERWVKTDPAVKLNRLAPEIHTWIQPENAFSKPPESNPMENYAAVAYLQGDKFQAHNGGDEILQRHLDFLKRQRESGDLIVGGPFRDGAWAPSVELLIFATSPEAAAQIVARDPLVMAGEVKPEVHPWMSQKGVLRK